MNILMIKTRRGSHDGYEIRQFFAGKRYDLQDSLAREFIKEHSAIELLEEAICHTNFQ